MNICDATTGRLFGICVITELRGDCYHIFLWNQNNSHLYHFQCQIQFTVILHPPIITNHIHSLWDSTFWPPTKWPPMYTTEPPGSSQLYGNPYREVITWTVPQTPEGEKMTPTHSESDHASLCFLHSSLYRKTSGNSRRDSVPAGKSIPGLCWPC